MMDSSIYNNTILKLLSDWLSPNRANRGNALAAAGTPSPPPSQPPSEYMPPLGPSSPPLEYMPPLGPSGRPFEYMPPMGGRQQPPQMNAMNPATWASLGTQSRTAAFDPTRDMNDPRNIHAVDENGRLIFGPYRMPRG